MNCTAKQKIFYTADVKGDPDTSLKGRFEKKEDIEEMITGLNLIAALIDEKETELIILEHHETIVSDENGDTLYSFDSVKRV